MESRESIDQNDGMFPTGSVPSFFGVQRSCRAEKNLAFRPGLLEKVSRVVLGRPSIDDVKAEVHAVDENLLRTSVTEAHAGKRIIDLLCRPADVVYQHRVVP